MFGIGIGIILGTTFMLVYKHNNTISDAKIEEKARAMGMHFDDECKVIFGEDEK